MKLSSQRYVRGLDRAGSLVSYVQSVVKWPYLVMGTVSSSSTTGVLLPTLTAQLLRKLELRIVTVWLPSVGWVTDEALSLGLP